jgi:6-phosphogluconate dehydrogenase
MMSAVAEAFQIMNISLGMTYDEIAEEFARWNADGELVSYDCKNCFR